MKRLKITRSPKKIPKEPRIISANDWLKSDPCGEEVGVPSHFMTMIDGLCCSIERSGNNVVRVKWVSSIEE